MEAGGKRLARCYKVLGNQEEAKRNATLNGTTCNGDGSFVIRPTEVGILYESSSCALHD